MLCPEELAASVTAAAVAISKALPSDKADLLGTVLTQLGDTIATITLARSLLEADNNTSCRSFPDNAPNK